MEKSGSNAGDEPTGASQSGETPGRLIIRVEIVPEEPPRARAPRLLNKRTLTLALAAIAAVTLVWLATSVFRSDPVSPASIVSADSSDLDARSRAQLPQSTEATPSRSDESPSSAPSSSQVEAPDAAPIEAGDTPSDTASVEKPLDATPVPIDEVIPTVPQSALQTIRGTVRVAIRVTIDREGTVTSAISEVPGPSRYFERLSREAATQWTFTPAETDGRAMLLRFHYTQEGPTAWAEVPQ